MSEWPPRIVDVSGTALLGTPAARVTGTHQRPVLPFRLPGTACARRRALVAYDPRFPGRLR